MSQGLGGILEKWRESWKAWRTAFFVILAVLVGLNFFIHPHHPHFGLDKYPGFFAGFGLVVGLGMVIIMKRIIQPFIARKEDFYGD
ncbi:hypothetical protein [Pseudodesulfovibrio tunisiensis]|uniref:hypothetical protein n=1 Tax=Pseudodesulfovibrio tunisiensis TaxID=463192 RepID=UPI001FB431DA|nr:hypothetical protein [Pseudodesulfovibrio tunisiensis]